MCVCVCVLMLALVFFLDSVHTQTHEHRKKKTLKYMRNKMRDSTRCVHVHLSNSIYSGTYGPRKQKRIKIRLFSGEYVYARSKRTGAMQLPDALIRRHCEPDSKLKYVRPIRSVRSIDQLSRRYRLYNGVNNLDSIRIELTDQSCHLQVNRKKCIAIFELYRMHLVVWDTTLRVYKIYVLEAFMIHEHNQSNQSYGLKRTCGLECVVLWQ